MSNLLEKRPLNVCSEKPCSAIKQLIHPQEKDLGGFFVRRLFPAVGLKSVGPWVFFDHMGPAEFAPGNGINVRPHPHIGIATVTYLFEGEILHRDSLGSYQTITPGDINLMIAGKGIVHSERERDLVTQSQHKLNGLQLWMALPDKYEEIAPEFHHYPNEEIPSITIDNINIRVMIGSAYGQQSPVKTFSETLYVEATMPAGSQLEVPHASQCAVYIIHGEICIDEVLLTQYSMAILDTSKNIKIKASQDAQIAFIGGGDLGKRYIEWNFVSSSKERIAKAKSDWKAGNFPLVPGDDEEFIPLP